MRINRNIGQLPTPDARRARGTTSPPDAKSGASVVSIGRQSSATAGIRSSIAARLDEVRAQLAEGTYEVDLDKLAESLVDIEFSGTEGDS